MAETNNLFSSWDEKLQEQLLDKIGDYMRETDADYSVQPLLDYLKPYLEEGISKDDLKSTLVSEASWEAETAEPFVSWLYSTMNSLESTSKSSEEDKNSKKRERSPESSEDAKPDVKKKKLSEDSFTSLSSYESPKEPSSSKILTAAERLAAVQAARASKVKEAPFGSVSREPKLSNFKSDRKSRNKDGSSDTDDSKYVPLGKREDKSKNTQTSDLKNRKRRNQTDDYQDGSNTSKHEKNHNGTHQEHSELDKCVFWPNCTKGDDCQFFHPTEPCKHFPNCVHGENCRYIHPPCKFGDNCAKRPMCPYAHSIASSSRANSSMMMNPYGMMPHMASMGLPPCNNGFACSTPRCPFSHPLEACSFGDKCRHGMMCKFSHAKPCRNGAACTMVGCMFAHPSSYQPAPQKPDQNTVTSISASLPLTPGKEEHQQGDQSNEADQHQQQGEEQEGAAESNNEDHQS